MPISDVLIFRDGGEDAPFNETLPQGAAIQPVAVNAVFDGSGAGGDYIPAVVLLNPSGVVIARAADPANVVTAGDDAEVSWFPGVKNGAAGGSATFYGGQLFAWREAFLSVVSGVVTKIPWDVDFENGDSALVFSHGVSPWSTWTVRRRAGSVNHASAATACLIVEWQSAFAGDRYCELAYTGGSDPWLSDNHPARTRDSGTPNGDIQTVSRDCYDFTTTGGATYAANVFQASGSNQILHASLSLLEQSNFLAA